MFYVVQVIHIEVISMIPFTKPGEKLQYTPKNCLPKNYIPRFFKKNDHDHNHNNNNKNQQKRSSFIRIHERKNMPQQINPHGNHLGPQEGQFLIHVIAKLEGIRFHLPFFEDVGDGGRGRWVCSPRCFKF